jgi:glycosyltransferase involved in cell wall biosynthesis
MRVAVMGRSVRPGATGVGRYAANLVHGLTHVLPQDALTLFVTQDAPSSWRGKVRELRAPFPTPNEYARALWEQTVVPAQTAALGVDVYHSPNYILPAALRCPSVVTIHDLAYLHRNLHRLTSHLYLSLLTGLAVRRATKVVAVSEHTRSCLESRYPHTAGRVEVIYEGVDPALRRPSPRDVQAFRTRQGLSEPYILFVGTQEPRKNLVRLVEAFEYAVTRNGLPHHLMLVGPRGWKTAALDTTIRLSASRERIHRVGYVADADLACWYAGAALFVYPSLDEGFGLPPLEAMACGTPVVTSNGGALPEVVGDAAITVNPRDTAALAGVISRVLQDEALADHLRDRGEERARRFSWDDVARQYVALYERTSSGGRR